MLKTEIIYMYEAFGLTISSEIALPELIQKAEISEHADLIVRLDPSLRNEFYGKPFDFVVEEQTVTVQIPEVGVFRIQRGEEIIVSQYEDTDEDITRLYLLGSCFGTLLLQRGIYPLHGSAIAFNGQAYAFVGDSGAGKSTLASAFMEKGYRLLSDDVIAVSLSRNENKQCVIPSYPQQKLWQQSLDAFNRSNISLRPIYGRENKFCIPINDQFYSTPLPLAGVFELNKTSKDTISIEPIWGLDRLKKLYEHTYRQFLIPKMNLTEWHFTQSTRLGTNIPFYQIERPVEGFSVYEIMEMIISKIHESAKESK